MKTAIICEQCHDKGWIIARESYRGKVLIASLRPCAICNRYGKIRPDLQGSQCRDCSEQFTGSSLGRVN